MAMTPQEQIEANRAYQRKYAATPKGKNTHKAAQRKYRITPEGRAVQHKYDVSLKGKAGRKAHRDRNRELAQEYLGGVCASCGTKEQLEFDHINPEDKSYTIGNRISSAWETIVTELDKCQLLCSGCHVEKSNEERRAA